jgi:hypothetical protein
MQSRASVTARRWVQKQPTYRARLPDIALGPFGMLPGETANQPGRQGEPHA